MKIRKRIPTVSCLFLVGLLFPTYVKADRYATLVPGDTLALADGETALVVFAYNQANATATGIAVSIQYTPSGGNVNTLSIPSTCEIKQASISNAAKGQGPNSENPLPLAGPATISVLSSTAYMSLRITSTEIPSATSGGGGGGQQASGTPSNSVVIPENAAGPVEIILESSTDLITWMAANPGSYGSSTEKRFFRVRAVESAP